MGTLTARLFVEATILIRHKRVHFTSAEADSTILVNLHFTAISLLQRTCAVVHAQQHNTHEQVRVE
jgi:hypothetical protein